MSKPRALDLFCGAGGVSVGLQRAGFDVVGVDIRPIPCHRGGQFVQADALIYPLEGFDFIWASPPCQRFTTLRHVNPGREYPDLIPATRARLAEAGIPYAIENVEGSPLGSSGWLTMLCGTMFGLQTPDGRAEIRRHRLFETSFSIALRPVCQHGHEPLTVTGHTPVHGSDRRAVRKSLTVTGTGMGDKHAGRERRRATTVTGNTPQTNTIRNKVATTFSVDDARAAMGIDWMPMKYLSQAIPPAYAEWIGRQALAVLAE